MIRTGWGKGQSQIKLANGVSYNIRSATVTPCFFSWSNTDLTIRPALEKMLDFREYGSNFQKEKLNSPQFRMFFFILWSKIFLQMTKFPRNEVPQFPTVLGMNMHLLFENKQCYIDAKYLYHLLSDGDVFLKSEDRGEGGRKRLPKFKFSAKFPIGLHMILQIQIKKFENDCYIMWKIILTENPSRCNLALLLK